MVPGTNKVDPANHNQLGADTDVLSQLRSGAVEFFTPPSVHPCPWSEKPEVAMDCRGACREFCGPIRKDIADQSGGTVSRG